MYINSYTAHSIIHCFCELFKQNITLTTTISSVSDDNPTHQVALLQIDCPPWIVNVDYTGCVGAGQSAIIWEVDSVFVSIYCSSWNTTHCCTALIGRLI